MSTSIATDTCLLELRESFSPCSDGPLINLGLQDSSSSDGGIVTKASWVILSRIGQDFLNTNLSRTHLCPGHYREYFEDWSPPDGCICGVKFIVKTEAKISLLLAIKVLRSEGKVLPIGRAFCEDCRSHYEGKYAAKPGERVMIILKKRKPETVPKKKEEPIDVKPSFIDLVGDDAPEEESPLEKRLKPDDDLIAREEEVNSTQRQLLPAQECKYYCKLCKITFYKESSYRLHKKTSLELHNRIKLRIRSQKLLKNPFDDDNEDGWKCNDCFIAFKDGIAMQKHLAEVHFTAHHPFHCKSCNIIFKSQSAFKSHNSRMHVSRIDKVYYCRECDDTFACKLKHARHILIHRPWNGDPDALQCKACGKVFTKHQTTSYNKHIKYHNESEFNEDCSCYDCSLEEDDSVIEEGEGEGFQEEEESGGEAEDETKKDVNPEDLNKPFQCSICPIKFASPKELEEHVANGVHEEYSVEGNTEEISIKTEEILPDDVKPPLDLLVPKKEECIDPFNYLEESSMSYVKPNHPISVSDLLNKMKLSFQNQSYADDDATDEDSEEENTEETVNKNFVSNGVYLRVYRGLPYTAYIKNRNMKTLLRRINTIAHKKGKVNHHKSSSIPSSHSSVSDEVEEGDDDIYSSSDLDEESENEEDRQNLLIPMENGWVCEKKWEEDQGQYSTFFWSPDGLQHSSLAIIRFYGEKKNLNLNMDLFTRAVENNPPPP